MVLGSVHRGVGAGQQPEGLFGPVEGQGDADRGTDVDVQSADGRSARLMASMMRRARSVASATSATASATTTNSSPPSRATKSPLRKADGHAGRDLAQDLVAHLVAVAVVDRLELVEVDEQHRGGRSGSLGAVHGRLDAGDGRRPVVDAGQRVVGCLVGEVGLQLVALDDRTREQRDRALQRAAEAAGKRLAEDRVVEVAVGEGVGLGVEQLQVRHEIGEDPERHSGLAWSAVAARGRLGVELALVDRVGVAGQVLSGLEIEWASRSAMPTKMSARRRQQPSMS